MPSFDARDYWDRRLAGNWGLTGTGHQSWSESYNRWLYRAKRRGLSRALRGLPAASALDVGSGTGWVLRQLQETGWSVAGCDIAPTAVERLHAELPGVPVQLVDAGRDPLPAVDASLDLVTAVDVAYHLVEPEGFAHLLTEVGRVLRPGGRLVVSDTFADEDHVPADHVRFRSAGTWRAACGPAGLEVDRLLPYFRRMSHDRTASRLPDGVRGAIAYAADVVAPEPPWMRLGVLRRR